MRNIGTHLFIAVIFAVSISAQTGGTFEITQSVVANGGGQSGGANFEVTGTSGQNLAGTISTGRNFGLRGGFWQTLFAPSAALTAISGQVITAQNQPIGKVFVILTDATGQTRIARTSAFGYFRFDDVEVGQTCIITVRHKRFQFVNETQIVFVAEEITDIVFNALPE